MTGAARSGGFASCDGQYNRGMPKTIRGRSAGTKNLRVRRCLQSRASQRFPRD